MKSTFSQVDQNNSFIDAWKEFGKKHPSLEQFAGVFAVAFPSTATVETNFSDVRISKEGGHDSFTDLSLQCHLHRKQYQEILEL